MGISGDFIALALLLLCLKQACPAAVAYAQLPPNVLDVGLDGADGDTERSPYLLVGFPLCKVPKDFPLTGG